MNECQTLVNIVLDVSAGNNNPDTSCSSSCAAAIAQVRIVGPVVDRRRRWHKRGVRRGIW